MILINTTFAVEREILDGFLAWIAGDFRAEARASVGGRTFLLTRVLSQDGPDAAPADADELTYACQFRVATREQAMEWMVYFSQLMLRESARRWGSKLLQFTTMMEIIPLPD